MEIILKYIFAALSDGTVDYASCISTAGQDSRNEWFGEKPFKCLHCGRAFGTKPSDGKVPVLKFWGMWTTASVPLLPAPL